MLSCGFLNQSLTEVQKRSGLVLGGFWIQEASKRRSGGPSGALQGRFGAPGWAQVGAKMGPKRGQKPIQKASKIRSQKEGENERSIKPHGIPQKLFLGAKIGPKPLQDAFQTALVLHHIFDAFLDRFFFSIKGRFSPLNWLPKPIKIDQKSMFNSLPFLLPFFD